MTEPTISYVVRKGLGTEDADILASYGTVTEAWDAMTTELRDLVAMLTVDRNPETRDDTMTTMQIYLDGSLTQIEELADDGTLKTVVQHRDEEDNTIHSVYGLIPISEASKGVEDNNESSTST